MMPYLKAPAQSGSEDSSLARAKELWEMAVDAKGGRDKLYQVRSLVRSDDVGASVDFMVFPDRFFRWADTRPAKLGLVIEMLNFERNFGYKTFGNPLDLRRIDSLSPEQRSRLLDPQLYYLLETKWFKPELLKAFKEKFNGKQIDIVEVRVSGYGKSFRFKVYLDDRTHLPARIGALSDERNGEMFDWVDLGDYREIAGIKVPTAISGRGSSWNKVILEINPEYNPEFFEREPDTKAGPFQWRRTDKTLMPKPIAVEPLQQALTKDQIAGYIKDLESSDSQRVLDAGRELIRAGEQVVPALTAALKSSNPDLRFFAAAALLSINRENEAGVQAMRDVLVDSTQVHNTRQEAAFRLMWGKKGRAELIGLMKHSDTIVRRCVIFAFDEITELPEIPSEVMQAVPELKQLLKDKDEIVRGMAEEVLEQIEGYQKNKAKRND